jgi:hypothetical protein
VLAAPAADKNFRKSRRSNSQGLQMKLRAR